MSRVWRVIGKGSDRDHVERYGGVSLRDLVPAARRMLETCAAVELWDGDALVLTVRSEDDLKRSPPAS